jgi:hypothetical protein
MVGQIPAHFIPSDYNKCWFCKDNYPSFARYCKCGVKALTCHGEDTNKGAQNVEAARELDYRIFSFGSNSQHFPTHSRLRAGFLDLAVEIFNEEKKLVVVRVGSNVEFSMQIKDGQGQVHTYTKLNSNEPLHGISQDEFLSISHRILASQVPTERLQGYSNSPVQQRVCANPALRRWPGAALLWSPTNFVVINVVLVLSINVLGQHWTTEGLALAKRGAAPVVVSAAMAYRGAHPGVHDRIYLICDADEAFVELLPYSTEDFSPSLTVGYIRRPVQLHPPRVVPSVFPIDDGYDFSVVNENIC